MSKLFRSCTYIQKDSLNVFQHVVSMYSIWAAGFKNAFYEESDRFFVVQKKSEWFWQERIDGDSEKMLQYFCKTDRKIQNSAFISFSMHISPNIV